MNKYYINEFIDKFCELHYITRRRLFSRDRTRTLVDKRAVLAFFLRHRTNLTWQAIGKIMNRNHASMINYVNNVESLMSVYPHISRMIEKTNKLFLEYDYLINKNTDLYTGLLTENQKLKEKVEQNEKLIKELIKLEKNESK
tara:strand:- start:7384 stop:7809 length:426 start_codon:yes stop_codon:yes gene_type:complete